MKTKLLTLLLILFVPILISFNGLQAMEFPNQKLRKDIAQTLFDGIESIDGVVRDVRNNTRELKWHDFRQRSIENAERARSWDELYLALNSVHDGIISRHSFVMVEKAMSQKASKLGRWPRLEIGYSWPEVSFFSKDKQLAITRINGVPIKDLFNEHYDMYCTDAFVSGCLEQFVGSLKQGYRFLGHTEQIKIQFADKSTQTIKQQEKKLKGKPANHNCNDTYVSKVATLRYAGHQACLFETDNQHIIKIFYFGSWGTDYGDIYCQRASEEGMCQDINSIKEIINATKIKSLVIDLQDNGGGSENAPWMAVINPNGYSDNFVAYRNLQQLQNAQIRENAFYYSDNAETWYESIKAEIDKTDLYLPLRTDFCRGTGVERGDACQSVRIPPVKFPIKYTDLRLVVNSHCVSSCDGFIWKTREFASAKTFGQFPSTDGAYARLRGYVVLSPDNKVKNIILGENQSVPENSGELLVSYQIPISKTVSGAGENLEGDGSALDYALPVTKSNFEHIRLANLQRTLAL